MITATKLESIKEVARCFLYVDIMETKVPFVASHPYTNSWETVLPVKGLLTEDKLADSFVDLRDEKGLSRWRKHMEGAIAEADLIDLFLLLNPPYILNFLKYTAKYMTSEDLGRVLGDFWQTVEQISLDTSFTPQEAIRWFRRADKKQLMKEESLAVYNSLPDMVTIYRGVTSHNKRKKKAFSWSIDRDIAVWFANRFSTGTGEVWTMQVPKERILCYFGDREKEVVVNLYGYNGEMKIEPVRPHGEEQ